MFIVFTWGRIHCLTIKHETKNKLKAEVKGKKKSSNKLAIQLKVVLHLLTETFL